MHSAAMPARSLDHEAHRLVRPGGYRRPPPLHQRGPTHGVHDVHAHGHDDHHGANLEELVETLVEVLRIQVEVRITAPIQRPLQEGLPTPFKRRSVELATARRKLGGRYQSWRSHLRGDS